MEGVNVHMLACDYCPTRRHKTSSGLLVDSKMSSSQPGSGDHQGGQSFVATSCAYVDDDYLSSFGVGMEGALFDTIRPSGHSQ